MKKKIILASTLITASTPIAVVVACNKDDGRNQIISKETQNRIQSIIDDLQNPISEIIFGKPIGIVSIENVQNKINDMTSWVILKSITLYKVDSTGKASQILAGEDAEKGFKYRLDFSVIPTEESTWEDSDNPTQAKIFTTIEFDGKNPSKVLDPNDFKNLEFKLGDRKKLAAGQIPLSQLTIDDDGRPWKGQVSFTLGEFEASTIGSSEWKKIPRTEYVIPGMKIRAKVHYHPIGSYAWKTGDPFELKTSTSEDTDIQFKVDPEMMRVSYPNIITSKSIDVNLFYGFVDVESIPGEGWIELESRTSAIAETASPESFNDYAKMTVNPIDRFNPEEGKIYMTHNIDVSSLNSSNKFVNFKLTYKNFFKDSPNLPFVMYDRDYTNDKLPYDGSAGINIIERDGDDLIVYTKSILYKQ